MPQVQQKITFTRGMNFDSSPEKLEDGEGRYRLNIRVLSSDNDENEAAETMLGNTLVEYTLPAGNNKVIGAKEFQKYGKIYSFVYNDENKHVILEYDMVTQTIAKVLQDAATAPFYLNFDKDHLITGIGIIERDENNFLLYWSDDYNEPKKINVQKAKYFSAGDFVNGYESPFDGDITYAIKKPQMFPPTYTWSTDTQQLINYLFKKFFKIRTQFGYDDKEVSSWSPESKYVLPVTTEIGGEDILTQSNKMTITVQTGSSIVKLIRIAAKEMNEPNYKIIAELNKSELNIPDNSTYNFSFYNNGNYLIVNPLEISKRFDSVPFLAKSLEAIDGQRLTYGDIVEGIDGVNIDMRLPLSYVPIDANPNTFFPKVSYLKPGGSYKTGVGYYEGKGNRSGAVNVVNGKTTEMVNDRFGTSLFIPFTTDPLYNPPRVAPKQGLDYVPQVGIEIYNRPPADPNITHYQIFRSKNEAMDRYIQFAAEQVLYVGSDKISVVPSPAATYVHIYVNNITGRYKFENPGSQLVYSFIKGDRIRFIANNHWTTLIALSGALAPGGGNSPTGYFPSFPNSSDEVDPLFAFNDNEIMAYDASTGLVTIRMSSQVPNNILPGALFEIYQPAENVISDNELMFEIGECHAITTDIHGNRVHSGATNQLIVDFATAAYAAPLFTAPVLAGHGLTVGSKVKVIADGYSVYGVVSIAGGTSVTINTTGYTLVGTFNGATPGIISKAALFNLSGGDSFRRWQDMPFSALDGVTPGFNRLYAYVDAENASNMFNSKAWDVGRPNRINVEYKRIRRESTVYYTDKFIPETNVNGLSTIYDDAFKTYDAKYGSIQRMLYENHRLILFQELKVGQIPVEQVVYNDLQSNQTVGASDAILSKEIIYYMGEFGIGKNPESLAVFAQAKYFIDTKRGVLLRLSTDGLTPISKTCKMNNHFTDVCKAVMGINGVNPKIYGVYDSKFNEYIISFEPILTGYIAKVGLTQTLNPEVNSSVAINISGVFAITMSATYPDVISIQNIVDYINDGTLPVGVTGTRTIVVTSLVASEGINEIVFTLGLDGNEGDGSFVLSTPLYDIEDKATFEPVYVGNETLAFNEQENGFSTFYSFLPDYMCGANTDIVTWKNGSLYTHNTNPVHMNFYGSQFTSKAWVVLNQFPSNKKVLQALSLEGDKAWRAVIETPGGQSSPLLEANFQKKEGFQYAFIKRDQNTPNVLNPIIQGNPMRGQTALIKLEYIGTDYNKLYAANVLFENSERSGR